MKDLEQKIKNGDTELQITYSECQKRIRAIREERRIIEKRYTELHDELIKQNLLINECRQRAIEQGYPNLFDDMNYNWQF